MTALDTTTRPRAALSDTGYEIPTVRLRRRRVPLAMWLSLTVIAAWSAYRAGQDMLAIRGFDHQALLWTLLMLAASHQTILAWFDKPYTVTPRQQQRIDQLHVTVSIPLYNESREVVDRVLYALMHQQRMPQRIDVVDDGSRTDYRQLRDFWREAFWEAGVTFSWTRQANTGKRHAQARTFCDAPDGIVVTLDSDTVLTPNALAEILKPFARSNVQSVAGVEIARNQDTNLLTRINAMRQISWQLVGCAALDRFGSILVNRGTFAAYRASLVRETVDAYVAEMFCGRPVKYSDDSLLTLYALRRGRAVQQLSAFQLAEYHDRLSPALRQWIRWMRGSTIRSIWRARYLRIGSYAWFINIVNWWQLFASSAAYVYVFVYLPVAGRLSLSAVSAAVASSYLSNVRCLLVARSDQAPLAQLDTFLLSPLSWLWSLIVLRPLRVYGMLTCANNGWGTRSLVEVGMDTGQGARDDTHENPLTPDKGELWLPEPEAPHTRPLPVVRVPGRGQRRGRRRALLPAPVLGVVAATVFAVGGVGALLLLLPAGRVPVQPAQAQLFVPSSPSVGASTFVPAVTLPSVSVSASASHIVSRSALPAHTAAPPARHALLSSSPAAPVTTVTRAGSHPSPSPSATTASPTGSPSTSASATSTSASP